MNQTPCLYYVSLIWWSNFPLSNLSSLAGLLIISFSFTNSLILVVLELLNTNYILLKVNDAVPKRDYRISLAFLVMSKSLFLKTSSQSHQIFFVSWFSIQLVWSVKKNTSYVGLRFESSLNLLLIVLANQAQDFRCGFRLEEATGRSQRWYPEVKQTIVINKCTKKLGCVLLFLLSKRSSFQ